MIRIGIICPSEIAFRRFLPSLYETTDFEYVGVAVANKEEFVGATEEVLDKERKKAQNFVDNYGGKIFDGYRTLICSDEVDAIYTPLPPALHYQWAKLALENGKHVMVEKPSTTCFADTQSLVNLATEKGLALHENYMFVFHDQMKVIDEVVKSGEIGNVRLYRISFGFPHRANNDFRYNRALGGGALLDAGGYTMKCASHFLGRTARVVTAQANTIEGYEVDMYGSCTMVNSKGVTAQLAFGMDNDYKCEIEIWGSKGTITSDRILTAPKGFVPSYKLKKNQEFELRNLPADDSFKKSIEHFFCCISDIKERTINYDALLLQAKHVEDYKNLSCLGL